jgi:hypothetical protein
VNYSIPIENDNRVDWKEMKISKVAIPLVSQVAYNAKLQEKSEQTWVPLESIIKGRVIMKMVSKAIQS